VRFSSHEAQERHCLRRRRGPGDTAGSQHPARPGHPPHRGRGEEVRAPAEGRNRPGQGERPVHRPAHQPPRLRRDDHLGDLQGPLADRAVLQGAQAESEGQDLRGHQRERAAHPDLDSTHRPAADQVDEAPVPGGLVPVPDGRRPSLEPLCLPRFAGLVGRPGLMGRRSTADNAAQPVDPGYWTADLTRRGDLNREYGLKRREIQQPRDGSGQIRAVLDSSVARYRKAIDEIGVLRGVIPICCECKKIRVDEKSWERIDTYISAHSEVRFSHGFCEDCMRKLYPEEVDSVLE